MSERERLIELLKSDSCGSPMLCDPNCKYANLERCYEERTADYLLENGVRVPPVVVGTTVYEFRHKAIYNGRRTDSGIDTKRMLKMAVSRGDDIYISAKPYAKSDFPRIGNTIFLTLEEAAEKLRILGAENAIEFR